MLMVRYLIIIFLVHSPDPLFSLNCLFKIGHNHVLVEQEVKSCTIRSIFHVFRPKPVKLSVFFLYIMNRKLLCDLNFFLKTLKGADLTLKAPVVLKQSWIVLHLKETLQSIFLLINQMVRSIFQNYYATRF